ncbi:MAG: glycosyltransferase family 2 protein [Chloroflexi bacterium]|nr:glycosyltransferase family 2 protein [Chloroflexota bacterium]
MNTPHPSLLALIPAYNESTHISVVVQGALPYLPVLVVDDGSTDETAQRAQEAGAQVLRQSRNQGKGAALRAGFEWALARDYDAVITLDADGQHDPAEIPRFIDLFEHSQADLIIGARDFSQIPPIRRLANTLGRWSFSWALGQPVQDNQSGYRLLSRRMMSATLSSMELGFEFEVEVIVLCVLKGYRLQWIPIRTIYGEERSHINPLKHTLNFIRVIKKTRQRRHTAQKRL